ncbi:MAG: hypothetical protein F4087_16170 [Gemmatimonadetes bacterium]|nr:hypothetical protein [Gemmatimonadota bacterium]MYA09920.1 hypothetical protein [Gemmatimonadota bacterium]MYE68850.1 hypothetical protein [Gemmatimonadota bacterium]MYJ70028.1 hypothetical protein [Gemmatimonadota bacterium]
MEENQAPDAPTHAELAAAIPPAPPDETNDAIVFAKKTMKNTLIIAVLFIGAAVVWTMWLKL